MPLKLQLLAANKEISKWNGWQQEVGEVIES